MRYLSPLQIIAHANKWSLQTSPHDHLACNHFCRKLPAVRKQANRFGGSQTLDDAVRALARRVCPAIRNLSRQELCGRLMALRVALPDVDVPAIVRKKPMLLLDEVCHWSSCCMLGWPTCTWPASA